MTELAAAVPRRRRRRSAVPFIVLGLVATALLAGAVAAFLALAGYDLLPGRERPIERASAPRPIAAPAELLDTSLRPISAEDAQKLNAARPADATEVIAARPFALSDSVRQDPAFRAALQCLTQAIYYEAGYESDAGQRGVAQVVLNRVRHPAFPNSVCGVVYQGSERTTGCQFTFTCDGSLARQPPAAAWARAQRVALAALSGWVEPSVGLSTHYHASYVLPYWADSLDKVLTVGTHIFYSMRGGIGSRQAFSARYDFAAETIPAVPVLDPALTEAPLDLPLDVMPVEAAAARPALAEDERVAQSEPLAEGGELQEAARPRLRADENRGSLNTGGSRLIVD